MNAPNQDELKMEHMRKSFEAALPQRLRRASAVKLQPFIPAHWFAVAASECAGMYIAGFFYGAISLAQAYVEALSRYLAEHHGVRIPKDPRTRCERLHCEEIISVAARDAAFKIIDHRDDFHHLNKDVEQNFHKLEARTEQCINLIHTLESEVFAYSFADDEPGKVVPANPDYWPSGGPGLIRVHLRQLW